jgi:DNA invertase Pin-like site-specific DNA recombinase
MENEQQEQKEFREGVAEGIRPGGPRKAVAYARVSTADKGQNPERQMDLIRAWAVKEGVELVATVVDEGTSGSTGPLDREAFSKAVMAAKAHGAEAIVVETVDRFSRQGVKLYGWACVEIERRHGLDLWMADAPLKHQEEMGGAVVASLKAELGRYWLERHRSAVRSGMARARAQGKRVGRPPKGFTPQEQERILQMRDEGLGWNRIAARLNEERGVHKLADLKARKRRATSKSAVAREFERIQAEQAAQNPSLPKSGSEVGEVVVGAK